ncbi:MAG: serpin family protein [Gemmatimonadales bacterium]|jgi:serpin B
MRSSLSAVSLATALLCAACAEAPITSPITHLPRDLTAGEQQLVSAGNHFAFALFHAIAAQESAESNLFVSPLSVGMALGMTVNGAMGATRDSMLHALQMDALTMDAVNRGYRGVIDLLRGLDPAVELTIANSIWYRNTIQPGQAFLDDVRTWFDAGAQGLDFTSPTAPQTINDWVSAQTQGMIPTIVDAIPPDVIMYLINAIYFKGSWTQRFDPALTRDAPFHLRDGSTTSVPTMEHKDPAPAGYFAGDGVTVVDLPYGGRAYAMTLVLPGAAGGIDSLVAGLTEARWDAWIAGLDSGGVIVTMPKFTLRWELALNDVLSTMGMREAFCGPWPTDFGRLYPPGGACISSVKHKTFVDVYEEGTVAAAVTSVGMAATDVGPPGPLRVVVDRPFLVAIRERLTGTILFLGRVTHPTAG